MDNNCNDCLQPPEACCSCVDGKMFVRVEDEIPFGGSDDDEVCYGPLDDCNCSRCAATRIVLDEPWIPAKMRQAWYRRTLTGRTKGDLRRSDVAWRKEDKRLSAMQRQGRG